jgi:glucose-6-phosphate isomerase
MTPDLSAHATRLRNQPLASLAAARAGNSILSASGWRIDLARQFLDPEADASLVRFGTQAGLEQAAADLFSGAIVNPSEQRPALHWALRSTPRLEGEAETVRQSVQPALQFARDVRSGTIVSSGGAPFAAIVHIGIGGSDFGPRLIADAFSDSAAPGIDLRFCANVDPLDLDRALSGLNPATTLVIGVSKSFGTEETLYNLARARVWLEAALGDAAAQHLGLVTAAPAKAKEWLGGRDAHVFDMPLSVGGRFSLWSAASLACMIYLGADTFVRILNGAHDMDAHTRRTPLAANVPMRLALLDYWNTSVRGEPMRVLLAYANRLRMLPTYLQQLEMESNGKTVGSDGAAVPVATAPALWGGEGSVGQHSYHQWLHQGSQAVPCEFILAPDRNRDPDGVTALTAHALAQAEVLANGRSFADVKSEEPNLTDAVAHQKVHAGGRPSTFMTHAAFSPEAFGALVAMYEHRTYFAGKLWGLNPFDQWGVERGKTMASRLKPALAGTGTAADPVTASLIAALR